jgi:hypothetical protein
MTLKNFASAFSRVESKSVSVVNTVVHDTAIALVMCDLTIFHPFRQLFSHMRCIWAPYLRLSETSHPSKSHLKGQKSLLDPDYYINAGRVLPIRPLM